MTRDHGAADTSTGNAENPNTAEIAAAINREHELAQQSAANAVEHARKAGELLLQAKESLAHGEWLPWLTRNASDISERTAQAYMRLARQCLADPSKAQRVADLSLRAALTQIAEPAAGLIGTEEQRPAKFDPFTFKRRLAEIDTNIDRIAGRMYADFKVDTDGLDRFERSKAWLGSLNHAPADIPLIPGHVTLGSIGDKLVIVLVESQDHPGYWHDIDLVEGNTSGRPVKPLGLGFRLRAVSYVWTTQRDDGEWLRFAESRAADGEAAA